MSQHMMWNQLEHTYRGQATTGAVITVAEDAMRVTLRQAGNGVFEPDWWVETLTRILEHWGVYCKRWTDTSSFVPRLHFTLDTPRPEEVQSTGPLSTRILSGPLDRNKRG